MKIYVLLIVLLLGVAMLVGGCEQKKKTEENSGRGEPEEIADSTRLDPAVDSMTPVVNEKQGY